MRSTTLFSVMLNDSLKLVNQKTDSTRPAIGDSSPRVTDVSPQSTTEQYKRKNPGPLKNELYGKPSISNSKSGMAPNQKQKRTRTAFTYSQMEELKRAFETDCYINKYRRADLAQRTKLTETQIKIWFGNRRMKQRNSVTKSKSTHADQYPNQSMSELSNYSPQSHQMHEICQPLIHQFHMQMPYGVGHTMPLHQIQNSSTTYPSYPLTSWNPTFSYNLTNSLPSSVTSQFHRTPNVEESPSHYLPTPNTTNLLPSPMFSEFYHSLNRQECPPDHSICTPSSDATVGLNNSENSNDGTPSDAIETIASMPRHITIANNNLYSPWSYTSSQPLQPISFSDIQSSSGNQMQYNTSGLSMHHHYPPSFIQQNLPTLSTLSEVRNIPQQYSLWY